MELLSLMKWPLIASLILPWLLVYLGLHIVQRGVIFVDLALAQTAAFGTCISTGKATPSLSASPSSARWY